MNSQVINDWQFGEIKGHGGLVEISGARRAQVNLDAMARTENLLLLQSFFP
jgi:hypothetical protein